MSAELLMESLNKLMKLHKSLYDIAVQKTEIIKKGDIDALNQLMKNEQAHIAAIQNIEEARMKAAKGIVRTIDNPSVSDCLPFLPKEQQSVLEKTVSSLKELVMNVKEQNSLNQQLLNQSLQFLHFSFRLLQPVQEKINYDRPDQKRVVQNGTGLFNYKA